jgi:hypothetical protein
MVVPLVEKVPGNADYRRAVGSSEIPLQGTGAFGMLLFAHVVVQQEAACLMIPDEDNPFGVAELLALLILPEVFPLGQVERFEPSQRLDPQ